jgi:succinoglycan biosynthesis transport protein ExoP
MLDTLEAGNAKPVALPKPETASANVADGYALPPILKQYWHTAGRWKWLIGGTIVASLIVGLIITLLSPSQFTAKSQIEISRDQKKITKVQGLDSETADRDMEFYETQYALLHAKSLADRVTKTLNLARRDEFFVAHGVSLNEKIYGASGRGPLSAKQLDKREQRAELLLLKNIGISPVRRSRLVTITYTSRQPNLSAEIANTWTQQFIAANMDRQLASTADARRFLEERLSNLKVRLEQSERDAVVFASKNDLVSLETTQDAQGKTQTQRTMAASDLQALNAALNAPPPIESRRKAARPKDVTAPIQRRHCPII